MTTIAKNPKVKIVNGNVKIVKIGLIAAFKIDHTNAASKAAIQLSTRKPDGKIIDKIKKVSIFVAKRTINRIKLSITYFFENVYHIDIVSFQ